MSKKKAIKLVAASAIAASSFAAVAPTSADAATSVSKTVSNAKSTMKAAYDKYYTASSYVSTKTMDSYIKKGKDAYNAAKKVVAKSGGSKKNAYYADLKNAYDKYIKNAEGYRKGAHNAYHAKKALDKKVAGVEASLTALDVTKATAELKTLKADLAKAEAAIKSAIYGGYAEKIVKDKYTAPVKAEVKALEAKIAELLNVVAVSVKATNATTVEVTFKSEVKDVESLNFAIEGLTVSNAAVKQTDSKTVVLTTSAQEGGKTYTVKLNGAEVGKFPGISAVVPTSIKMTTTTVQGKVGSEVTLKADIGQKVAGVAVTFNVDAPAGSLNKDQVFEVYTNAEGIAEYSYTQYNAGTDEVVAYPTGNAQARSFGKVYWGVDSILTIEEDTKGSTVANGTKKVYTVTYKDPTTGKPLAGQYVNVTLKENVDVPYYSLSKATVTDSRTGLSVVPFQANNGTQASIQVLTDVNGKATFTVSGTNTTATPVAFVDGVVADRFTNDTNDESANNERLEVRELQASASQVTYQGVLTNAQISVTATGSQEAATGSGNGRVYTVKVLDKDGKPYKGQVNLALNENIDNVIGDSKAKVKVLATGQKGDFIRLTDSTAKLHLNNDGEATFLLYGDDDKVSGTPVVWIDQNDANNYQSGKLEQGEPFGLGEITYFQGERVIGAKLGVYNDGVADTTFLGNETAEFRFNLTNQSSKTFTQFDGKVTLEVNNTGRNAVEVTVPNYGTWKDGDGNVVARNSKLTLHSAGSVTLVGDVDDIKDVQLFVKSFNNLDSEVTVNAHAVVTDTWTHDSRNNTTVYAESKSATFSKLTNGGVDYGKSVYGTIVGIDKENDTLAVAAGNSLYSLSYEEANVLVKGNDTGFAHFEANLSLGDEITFKQASDADGKATFNLLDTASYEIIINQDVTLNYEGVTYDFADTTDDVAGGANEGVINGDVYVSAADITLENVLIKGDLYLTEDQTGDFDANNVKVTGTVYVLGGDTNTTTFKNSELQNLSIQHNEHIILDGSSVEGTASVLVDGVRLEGKGSSTIANLTVVGSKTEAPVLTGDLTIENGDQDNTDPATPEFTFTFKTVNKEQAKSVVVTGTGEAGSTVALTLDDADRSNKVVTKSVEIGQDGKFSSTVDVSSLVDGEITVEAVAKDAANNESEKETGKFLLDQANVTISNFGFGVKEAEATIDSTLGVYVLEATAFDSKNVKISAAEDFTATVKSLRVLNEAGAALEIPATMDLGEYAVGTELTSASKVLESAINGLDDAMALITGSKSVEVVYTISDAAGNSHDITVKFVKTETPA